MKNDYCQQVFLICSYLLSYPDKSFLETLPEIEDEVEKLPFAEIKDELTLFLQTLGAKSENELIATYVYTFDFGKKTNLYVTYMSNGEQRERGQELLFLKNYYQMHGFSVTTQELPDYLPMVLEFAGQVDFETAKPIFERYGAHIKEIETRLQEENNFYYHLLKALNVTLTEAGIKLSSGKRSEGICSSSFCG